MKNQKIHLLVLITLLLFACRKPTEFTTSNLHTKVGIGDETSKTIDVKEYSFETVSNNAVIKVNESLVLKPVARIKSKNFDNSLSIIDVDDACVTTFSMGYLQRYYYKDKKIQSRQIYDLQLRSKEISKESPDSLSHFDFNYGQNLWGVLDQRKNLMLLQDANESGSFDYRLISINEALCSNKDSSLKYKYFCVLDGVTTTGFISNEENDLTRYYVDILNNWSSKVINTGENRFKVDILHDDIIRNYSIDIDLKDLPTAFSNPKDVYLIENTDNLYIFRDYAAKTILLYDDIYKRIVPVDFNELLLAGPSAETSIEYIRTFYGDYSPVQVLSNRGLIIFDTCATWNAISERNPWMDDDRKRYTNEFYQAMDIEYQLGDYDFNAVDTKWVSGFFLPYRSKSYPVELKYYDRNSASFHTFPLKVYACQTPYPVRLSLDEKYLAVPEQAEDGSFGYIGIYRVKLQEKEN